MTYYIYTLSCPIDSLVKYIGMTSNLEKRFNCHKSGFSYNNEKDKWIHDLKYKNLIPNIEILELFDNKYDAMYFESYWINQFKEWGFLLFNKKISHNLDKQFNNMEIKNITRFLDHGDKKKLAFDVLKIQPSALSRYIRLKRMPSSVYSKILIFISNKEINN